MSNVSLRELQLFQLQLLDELDRICKKNDITYFLSFGSCLGAIRHEGFIPWDDDIDITMKIDDYLKFMEACKTDLGEKFYFQSHMTDAKTYVHWNRIGVKNSTSINTKMANVHTPWGVCIDIFPTFSYPEDAESLKKQQKYIHRIKMLCVKYYHLNTLDEVGFVGKLKKSVHALCPNFLNVKLFNHYFKKLVELENENTTYLSTYEPANNGIDMTRREDFVPMDHIFEGKQYPIPRGYDTYLSMLYGDYMEIPKDKTNHTCGEGMIVKLDEPYQNYWK